MFFSDKQDLKKISSSLIQLGYLIAGGNPSHPEAQKQISRLNRVMQKLDSRLKPIENLRIFEKSRLSDFQKLKIYELFLQTVGRNPSWCASRSTFSFRNSFRLDRGQLIGCQSVGAQAGAWAAFIMAAGALLARPIQCFQKMLSFGIFLGQTLQGLKDLQDYRDQIQLESRSFCAHYEQALRKAQKDLADVFQKISSDFQVSESSLLVFQIARKLSLGFTH